jgi:hypothetical protein
MTTPRKYIESPLDKAIREGGLPGTGSKPWVPKGALLRAVRGGIITYEEAYEESGPGTKAERIESIRRKEKRV